MPMFYKRFGNKWYQKLRRKIYMTNAEREFLITPLFGCSEFKYFKDIKRFDCRIVN